VTDSLSLVPPVNLWLSRFAKLTVVFTLVLILLGGLVTTFGAGMAVPTWPTIKGEMNPSGWWQDHQVLLEHSHRLTAITVGVLTGILCAWIWQNWWALLAAFIVSGLAGPIGHLLHLDGNIVAQLRIWPSAFVFLGYLLVEARRRRQTLGLDHWLVLAAYVAVCVQATLGGLRVTQETSGFLDTAMVLRVVHGIFAHAFLAILVVIAVRLSPVWNEMFARPSLPEAGRIRRLANVAIGLYFAQLIVAAAMRHPGAGLAIPTWPQAQLSGSLFPAQWTTFTTLNFLHTRVIAILLTGHVIGLAARVWRSAGAEPRLFRPGTLLIVLTVAQFILGVLVVWRGKHPHITTAHVFNGAAVLATVVLLAARAGRASGTSTDSLQTIHSHLLRATA
jgi:cytochrome c oxidase assembly protein subunit 15